MNGLLQNCERDELIPEVAIFTEGRPTRLVSIISRNHVIRIPTDPIPEQYAFHVVRYCEMSAWAEDPALILKLLKKWAYVAAINQAIQRISGGAPPVFYANGRVWDTCRVALDLPFLNRETTRRAIEYFSYPLDPGLSQREQGCSSLKGLRRAERLLPSAILIM